MKNLHITTFAFALLLTAPLAACKKKGAGGGGGATGVAKCDDYLARMDACSKKMAGKGGEQLTKMADMMRSSWKDDVKDTEKKKEMPAGCKSAIKDMAKQMPDCDWGVPAAAPAAGSDSAAGSAAAPAGSAAAPAGSDGSAAAGSAK